MTKYYHSAPLLLDPGSIIQPGNWGRILNAYRKPVPAHGWMLARELAFESIRTAEFAHLPSRLSCAFAFETFDQANQYKTQFSPWNPLYEVELVDPGAACHRGGFNLVNFPADHLEFLPVVISWARQYWRGEQLETPELVTKSPLRVKHMVSSGPGCYQP